MFIYSTGEPVLALMIGSAFEACSRSNSQLVIQMQKLVLPHIPPYIIAAEIKFLASTIN